VAITTSLGVNTWLGGASVLAGQMVGGDEHVASDGLQVDLGAQQPGRDPLDDAPFPDGRGVEPAARGQSPRPLVRVAAKELDGVLPHEDADVVLGFCEARAQGHVHQPR
jgi:hypothetical protein